MYAVCHHSTTRMRASTGVRTTVTKGGHRCPQVSMQTRVRSLSLRLLAHASSLFLCSHHHKHETDGKHGEEHNANAQHCRSPAGPLHLGPAPSCGCMRDFSHRCARGLAWVVRMFKDMSAVVRAEAGVCSAKFGEQDVDLAKLSPVWAPAARRREAASVRPVLSRTPRPVPCSAVPCSLFVTLRCTLSQSRAVFCCSRHQVISHPPSHFDFVLLGRRLPFYASSRTRWE